MKYTRKNVVLPIKLIIKLNEITSHKGMDYRTANNFIKCVAIIYNKQINEQYNRYYFVAVGSRYWKKVYGGNYYERVIQPLLELDIIQSHDFGYRTYANNSTKGKEKGLVGIRYRINPLLIEETLAILDFKKKKSFIDSPALNDNTDSIKDTINSKTKEFSVGIENKKVFRWIEENAERMCEQYINLKISDSMPVNYPIECKYSIGLSYNTKHTTIEMAKKFASKKNLDLFYYKDTFYIDDRNRFIKHQIEAIKLRYKTETNKINLLPIEFKRNRKTLRVYNHLTSFPSHLLPFLSINNKTIVQIDLKTSQFLLLANLINNFIAYGPDKLINQFKHEQTRSYLKRFVLILEENWLGSNKSAIDINNPKSNQYSISDLIRFIREVFFGDFYEIVKSDLNLSERAIAKQTLFRIIFGKSIRPGLYEKKLRELYPTLMSIFEDYKDEKAFHVGVEKKENLDYTNLSVFLQCVESEIYIDNILIPLQKKGIPCFTRHDSIVVPFNYEDEVWGFIQDVFKKFNFRLNAKIEDMFWQNVDYDDLDASGYLDWLSDQNELSQ